jgi:hypothetical protein
MMQPFARILVPWISPSTRTWRCRIRPAHVIAKEVEIHATEVLPA